MSRLTRSFLLALLLFPLGTAALSAEDGWLVYELKFTADTSSSLNFQFYNGAYLVAPISGGSSSLVLTSEDGGRFYALAQEAARVFTAASPAVRKTVLSAIALNGSSQACYMAAGDVNQTITLPGPKGLRSFRVADSLRGTMIASDDDSEAALLAADGSLGMIGSAVIEARLREDLTFNASKHASQNDAVLYLAGLLERYGYTEEGAPAPTAIQTIEGVSAADGADAALFPTGSAAVESSPNR